MNLIKLLPLIIIASDAPHSVGMRSRRHAR